MLKIAVKSLHSSLLGMSIGFLHVRLVYPVRQGSIKQECPIKFKKKYLNGAIVNIDNTLIYGWNVEEFLSILDRILSQMAIEQIFVWNDVH